MSITLKKTTSVARNRVMKRACAHFSAEHRAAKRLSSLKRSVQQHQYSTRRNSYIGQLDRNLLAPGLFHSIGRTMQALAIPLVVVAFVASAGLRMLHNPDDALAFLAFADDVVADTAEAVEIDPAIAELNMIAYDNGTISGHDLINSGPLTLNEQKHLLNFIAGLIAQFRPSTQDVGAIAKEIVTISARENVDPFYVAAIVSVESSFRPTARSHVGARGLMQLMPATAKELAENRWGPEISPNLHDPKTNIQLGIEYIKRLEHRFKGNRYNALAAYNWGFGNVDKVKSGEKTMPTQVKGYAQKILERTHHWKSHYKRAKASASALG